MSEQKRKLAFYEIGKGTFAAEMQGLFEQAQVDAQEIGAPVKIVSTIIIHPPEKSDSRYGKIQYKSRCVVPEKVSMEYTTELANGVIVNDGKSVEDILQLKLDLPEPVKEDNRIPFEARQ